MVVFPSNTGNVHTFRDFLGTFQTKINLYKEKGINKPDSQAQVQSGARLPERLVLS